MHTRLIRGPVSRKTSGRHRRIISVPFGRAANTLVRLYGFTLRQRVVAPLASARRPSPTCGTRQTSIVNGFVNAQTVIIIYQAPTHLACKYRENTACDRTARAYRAQNPDTGCGSRHMRAARAHQDAWLLQQPDEPSRRRPHRTESMAKRICHAKRTCQHGGGPTVYTHERATSLAAPLPTRCAGAPPIDK